MHIDELLGRFADLTEQPDGGFLAVCPAHNDSHPSLRIWVGEDRKVRTTCRAGCSFGDIAEAAKLRKVDFFDVTGEVPMVAVEPPALVGSRYSNALGMFIEDARLALQMHPTGESALDYVAERFGISPELASELHLGYAGPDAAPNPLPWLSRSFRAYPRVTVPLFNFAGDPHGLQGRDISGKCPGRWLSLSNPDGHRWGSYGVFRGGAGYEPWIITEGPGDGLTATALGYDSVVVRGAALVSSPDLMRELADGLRGRLVIVCGDADRAGQEFNRRVSDGFRAHGIDVFALELPEGAGDVTAWRESNPESFAGAFHAAVKAASPLPAENRHERERAAVSAALAERTGAEVVDSDQGAEAGRILGNLIERYGDTDAMNAHALVAWTQGRIRYAPGLGFYVWNGRVWERSEVKVRQEVHRMGAALMLAGKLEQAKAFLMTTRIDALMTELRSVPSVYVAPADFDARPELLSFANGTVNLRTGELRPHSLHDMLTYALDIDYKPSAPAPRWESFLGEIFPEDPELVPYIQRLVGYGITGHTDEQAFAVLWGKGANGKSVLTDTLSHVFGRVSKTTPFATFEEKASGGIPNDIAALRGARLVMASEGESGKPMSEAVLKRVTGKDVVSARFLRQEFFEFRPSFLLLLATNHKPKFRGQDDGLWRRVKMIPFKRFFAPAERDYGLDAKLRAEAEGIAAWAVRGAMEWFVEGLRDPQCISQATADYRDASDALAGFFPGVIERAEGAVTLGSEVYNAYREWCEAEGLPAKEIWTRKALYSALEERKVSSKRVAKGMALVGVRLTPTATGTGPGIFGGDD